MSDISIVDVFRAESSEIIQNLEVGLVSLEDSPDQNLVNDLFRGFHTLKGSAGMAGFDQIAEVTHLIESRLDEIRSGSMKAGSGFVDLVLAGIDWIKGAIDGTADLDEKTLLLNRLSDPGCLVSADTVQMPFRYFRVRIVFRKDIFTFGIDPLMIIEDLAALGTILKSESDRSCVPPLHEIDPELCYLPWLLILKTQKSQREVDNVFIFIKDDNDIQVDDITESFVEDLDVHGAEERIGDLLVKKGLLTSSELHEVLDEQDATNAKVGELIVRKGLASEKEINSVLKLQESSRKEVESNTVRVDTAKLDSLMNLLGEIVIGQSSLARLAAQIEDEKGDAMRNAIYALDRVTREFQEQIMMIRMIPVGPTFSQFKRFVRDVSKTTGKNVFLEIVGAETELDKTVIEKISDPLKHMIRNAIDHGIETAEERIAAGKNPEGRIELKAYHQEGNVYIAIEDDGQGIDVDRIKEKALTQGLLSQGEEADRDKLLSLIFLPGFSTAEKVSDLSGRGVGMDVVKNNISQLRGSVDVVTEKGKGSRFLIKLPLTMAIIEGMLCRVGSATYIVPLLSILESIQPKKGDVKSIEGKGEVVFVRGDYITLVRLYEFFGVKPEYTDPTEALLLVVESSGVQLALLIDDLIGQQQVVIKSLDSFISKGRSVSGAAIMGDGTVALIVDIHGLVGDISKR